MGETELRPGLCGIGGAEEGFFGKFPGLLLERRLLLGGGRQESPALPFVEGRGVVDDESVGGRANECVLLGGPVGGRILAGYDGPRKLDKKQGGV